MLSKLLRRSRERGEEGLGREAALLYLSALASANPDDNMFLAAVAETEGPLSGRLLVLRKAVRLVRGWSYPTASALSAAAKTAPREELRELAEKMSKAVNIGMRVSSLVSTEYEKMREHAQINFERAMERVKTMGDVFSTILSSSSFLLISFMIASIIFSGIDPYTILALIMGGVAAGLGGIVYYIYRISGSGSVLNPSPYRPLTIYLASRTANIGLIAALSAALAASALAPLSIARVVLAAAPAALIAAYTVPALRLRKIPAIDEQLPFFMKSLAETLGSVQVPEKVLEIIRLNDYGALKKYLERLYLRVKSGVDFFLSLRVMAGESCSGLLYEAVEVFVESLKRGVPAGSLGRRLYDYLADRIAMRRRRQQVSSYVRGILFPTSCAVAAILGLMDSLYILLASYSSLASTILPLSPAAPPEAVSRASMAMIVMFSSAGSLALHFAERRSGIHLCLTFGMLLLASALTFLAVSMGTYAILESMTSYARSLREMVPT
ncbi:MAG: type II secretion system F family protein [Aigarchaeota archaeon]|nr:type II secretion system F family protein [Candidatus Calditenuaceae archaeon]